MSRKSKVFLFGGTAAVLILAAVIAIACSRCDTGYGKEEIASDAPELSGETAAPPDNTPDIRPEYPDWEEIASTPEPVSFSVSSAPPVTWPGGHDLDESGQPLQPHVSPGPSSVPIYQNESETSS